jgi:hypothetical protein
VYIGSNETIEYVGQNKRDGGKLKYFARKQVLESPQLFSSVLAYYSEQIKDLLAAEASDAKLENVKCKKQHD